MYCGRGAVNICKVCRRRKVDLVSLDKNENIVITAAGLRTRCSMSLHVPRHPVRCLCDSSMQMIPWYRDWYLLLLARVMSCSRRRSRFCFQKKIRKSIVEFLIESCYPQIPASHRQMTGNSPSSNPSKKDALRAAPIDPPISAAWCLREWSG